MAAAAVPDQHRTAFPAALARRVSLSHDITRGLNPIHTLLLCVAPHLRRPALPQDAYPLTPTPHLRTVAHAAPCRHARMIGGVTGVAVVDGTPTSANRWVEGTSTVAVANGTLSILAAAGAVNNKLAVLDITPAEAVSAMAPRRPECGVPHGWGHAGPRDPSRAAGDTRRGGRCALLADLR